MHHIHDLFSHHAPAARSPLAALDVRVRLVVALGAIATVVLSDQWWLGATVFGLALGALLVAGVGGRTLLCRFGGPILFAALILVMRGVLSGTTPLWTIPLGPAQLTITREGVAAGALVACRILGASGVLIVACHGAAADELLAALHWLGAPRLWVEIANLMYRYIHVFFAEAAAVLEMQKIRLGYRTWRGSFSSLGQLTGMVLLRALDQADRSHEALRARGYQGRLPLPTLPPLPWPQRLAAAGGFLVSAATYWAARGMAG